MTGTGPRVLVLTTSFPRTADDAAGRFVADAVEHVRARGLSVDVVSPASFRHFGIAYGHGIVGNLRARPWRAAALPLFFASFRRAARVRARDADVVHAHWLPAGAVAATLGRPYVLQVWGSDVALARYAPWVARPILRRAAVVVAASQALAEAAEALGARDVRVVPSGVELPAASAQPSEPPHVLFAGRLSPEKGIEEFLAATEGLPRVVVGEGPVVVPESVGAVSPQRIGAFYDRAAVVAVPSRREGYGMVAREAMAHGRAVVATAVGGLAEAVDDEVTGLLVPPRDARALRTAIERVLADTELRTRLGEAARDKVARELTWEAAAGALVELYDAATLPRCP